MLKFLKKLFSGKSFIQRNAEEIISVLNFIKLLVDTPGARFAVEVTKTPIDNIVLDRLSRALPIAIIGLESSLSFRQCYEKGTIDEQIDCIIEQLRYLRGSGKKPTPNENKLYLKLAIKALKGVLQEKAIYVKDEDLESIINGTYQLSKLAQKQLNEANEALKKRIAK